jgi:hypothetical protein
MTVGIPGFSCRAPILSSAMTRLPSSFQVTDCHMSDATPAAKPAAAITVLATSRELTPDPDTGVLCQKLQLTGNLLNNALSRMGLVRYTHDDRLRNEYMPSAGSLDGRTGFDSLAG